MAQTSNPEKKSRQHTQRMISTFDDVIKHLRQDIDQIEEPQAKAMFETAAEVIWGLKTAFEHYQTDAEEAWR